MAKTQSIVREALWLLPKSKAGAALLLLGCLLGVCSCQRTPSGRVETAAGLSIVPSTQSAIVLHDGSATGGEGLQTARYAANLLGHFGLRPLIEPFSAYRTGEALTNDVVIVCGALENEILPEALLTELARSPARICWLGRHIEQFLRRDDNHTRLGFDFLGYTNSETAGTVTYGGMVLPRTAGEIVRTSITDSNQATVLARQQNLVGEDPYLIRSGRFWYFAGMVFSYEVDSDQSLVFADALHEVVGEPHRPERRALVRIEDVSADSDPEDLRRVADFLYARGIPFQIALIPIFRDPADHVELYLSDNPEVVAAVHYMVERGGTIFMHGITHQFRGRSADDYEFWDVQNDQPTPDGSLQALQPKFTLAFRECFRTGLYPVAFETPHYVASIGHYRAIVDLFSHVCERRMVSDVNTTVQTFPYAVVDWLGQGVIPENMGYIEAENPDPKKLLEIARRLKAVRDPLASFYFHPFMPTVYLQEVVEGLKAQGYTFVSARDFGSTVNFRDYVVTTAPAALAITSDKASLRRIEVDRQGRTAEARLSCTPGVATNILIRPAPGQLVAIQGTAHPLGSRLANDVSGSSSRASPDVQGNRTRLTRALLLTPERFASFPDATNVANYEALFRLYAIPVERMPVDNVRFEKIGPETLVVAPDCAATDLTEAAAASFRAWVEAGGQALVEGDNRASRSLGFDFRPGTITVNRVNDLYLDDGETAWAQPTEAVRIEIPLQGATLVEDARELLPMATVAPVGRGRVIQLAAAFDPGPTQGYGRFPFLMHHLRNQLGLDPLLRADGVEYYFDPGLRPQNSVENLVQGWSRDGVRAIYAAAWHSHPRWTYDYARLIELCHARNIAVYAWFEFPQVSDRMWDEHPEWREKTASGADGTVGWRKQMNLANRDCLAASLDYLQSLLTRFDWDGVNIAELCFDTTDGLLNAEGYVPMNAEVRRKFAQESGFDPIQLFDPASTNHWERNPTARAVWEKFRSTLLRDWTVAVLDRVEALGKTRPLDVIVTALDSLHDPRITEKIGTDTRALVALMKEHAFTLQVEDPEESWTDAPDRYDRLGRTYRELVPDASRLMFDINAVKDRDPEQAATPLLGGVELALTLRHAAAAGNGRVAVYSEATLRPEDRALAAAVMAGPSLTWNGDVLQTSSTKTLKISGQQFRDKTAMVDGEHWRLRDRSEITLPPGQHRVVVTSRRHASVFDRGFISALQIKDSTAELTRISAGERGLRCVAFSPRRAWITVSREPSLVLLDGRPNPNPMIRRTRGEWIIQIPAGRHDLEIEDHTTFSAAVDLVSFESSTWIVVAGGSATALLFLSYVAVRIRRLLTPGFRPKASAAPIE